jgi:N-acetylglucosamine-1-phosphate uridyltransferase (contains nucleotidyltransferase and I-patch acetyltransferase domains)
VEIKNSHIKKGSKAAHLSYIGDAEVGENCNIGCGVIFCNYDGIHKHKTVIGDNCFIGSNVNLIAPLFIGNNCFIAAGTTLSDSIENNTFVRNSREIITHPNKFHK